MRGPNLVTLRFWAHTFFAFNCFPHCPQWKRRLITGILSAVKRRATESVNVGDVYSSTKHRQIGTGTCEKQEYVHPARDGGIVMQKRENPAKSGRVGISAHTK